MDEAGSPHLYGDPCHLYGHLYSHFVEKQLFSEPSTLTPSATTTSRTSSSRKPLQSMLVTGFGMRNVESLQRALLDDEQRRQMLMARYAKDEEFECLSVRSTTSSNRLLMKSISTQSTEITSESDFSSRKSFSLQYLLGIGAEVAAEEYEEKKKKLEVPPIEGEVEEAVDMRITLAMRKARKYLKQHRIFEFFQFLIAHMLSELPDNPIQFLMDLLDKCLVYRSGFGQPPLLYEKPHLEQLFYLMDRMRTGFIELEQYKTGMRTLGICSFDNKPPLSSDGMVAKDTFIEEAYDCLTDLFVDMIRRRGGDKLTTPSLMTPPPTEVNVMSYDQ